MVVAIGATVAVLRCGRTSSRVRVNTGRALSSCATWIARIRPGRAAGPPRTRRALRALGAGEDPGIAFCEFPTTLTLECPGHDSGPAALGTGVDDLVNEVNKVIWESHCDLLAHPKLVAKR
jgi:hypothetical protein